MTVNGHKSAPVVDPLRLEVVRRKYAEEAQKRLKPEGSSQFIPLTDAEEDRLQFLGQDPWVDHETLNQKPSPIKEDVVYKFFILGAGFGGLQYAVRLIESGLATPDEIRFLDAAGGFGGTWYWNRYPGLHCDLESYIYMPLLEETGHMPSQKYAPGAEIRDHAERIARQWKLSDSVLFRAQVHIVKWEDTTDLWTVEFAENRGPQEPAIERTLRAQYVYIAAGGIIQPQIPKLPGLSSFSGDMFHTARWNYNVSGGSQDDQTLSGFRDKRVAVIGTAATAIGVIPEVAKHAKELFIVQRTPAYVKPRNQYTTEPDVFYSEVANKTGWQWERQLNWNSFITNAVEPGQKDLIADGWTDMPAYSALLGSPSHGVVDPAPESLERHATEFHSLDLPHMDTVRARVDELVDDQETAEKLKPWYPTWCKRPTFSDTYLQLFNEPHVHLIDTNGQGPSGITEKGVLVGGEEHEVDVIVFSTGYQFGGSIGGGTGSKSSIKVIGRNGVSLDEKWKTTGAATLHGYASNGFPNLFFTGASQGTATGNNVMMLGIIAENVAHVIDRAFRRAEHGQRPIIEVTRKAEEAHTAEVLKRAPFFSLLASCTPGYFNGHGDGAKLVDPDLKRKRARGSIWSEGTQSFVEYIKKWREEGDLNGLTVELISS